MFDFLRRKSKEDIPEKRQPTTTGWSRFGERFEEASHKKNITRLEKSIKTTSRWHMIWSGTLTGVLASAIIGVGQPLWEITVVHPLTLSKLKQDLGDHLKEDAAIEKRMDLHEKLLTTLTVQVEELIRVMRRLER
jgi:hypothetical protein